MCVCHTALSSHNLPVNITASLGGLPRKQGEFVGLGKKYKWTANLLEATGGFEWPTEVCAGNITAPEPPGGLHQTGLYSCASDSWVETHLRANSSEEKVTKPKWVTGKWNLQRPGCFDSLLTHLTLAAVSTVSDATDCITGVKVNLDRAIILWQFSPKPSSL